MLAGSDINIPLLMSGRVVHGIGRGGTTEMGPAAIGAVIPSGERGRYPEYFLGPVLRAKGCGTLFGGPWR